MEMSNSNTKVEEFTSFHEALGPVLAGSELKLKCFIMLYDVMLKVFSFQLLNFSAICRSMEFSQKVQTTWTSDGNHRELF